MFLKCETKSKIWFSLVKGQIYFILNQFFRKNNQLSKKILRDVHFVNFSGNFHFPVANKKRSAISMFLAVTARLYAGFLHLTVAVTAKNAK